MNQRLALACSSADAEIARHTIYWSRRSVKLHVHITLVFLRIEFGITAGSHNVQFSMQLAKTLNCPVMCRLLHYVRDHTHNPPALQIDGQTDVMLVALVLTRNAWQIERFNSVNYEIIGRKFTKFVHDVAGLLPFVVNFGPVTHELTELICELLVRHSKKLAYLVKYLRIYWTDLCNFFHSMKAIWVQMIDLDLVFRFVKRRCHGNQIMLGEVMNDADWYYLHSLH